MGQSSRWLICAHATLLHSKEVVAAIIAVAVGVIVGGLNGAVQWVVNLHKRDIVRQ
jgi:hypothetical protein